MKLSKLVSMLESETGMKATRSGDDYACRCPAHDDNKPSLSICEGDKGLLLNCHAGCTVDAIAAALGIKPAELFYKNSEQENYHHDGEDKLVSTYDYCDATGNLIFQVCLFEPKDFRQRQPDPKNARKFIWNLKGIETVPYRLPQLLATVQAGETTFVVEGEKDVAALVERGFAATCNAGGAGKWKDNFAQHFDKANSVVIIADKDVSGRKHAVAIATNLRGKAQSVKVLELPDMAGRAVKDASDFFEAGGTADQLREIAKAAKEFETPTEPTKADNATEPAGRVTSAGLICVGDDAKIAAVPLYYYADKSAWYAPDNRGGYFKATSAAAQSFLADYGFSKAFKDSQGNSPAERALFWKMQNNSDRKSVV